MFTQVKVDDRSEIGVVESVSGGWTSVRFGAEIAKYRNSRVHRVITKEKKVQQQRQPAPAHFVGDVAPGKVARVKDTTFDLSRYFVSDIKTVGGRRTLDCADEIAARLRGKSIEEVYAWAAEVLECSEDALRKQYGHLNLGMQRMNLGNRIRGADSAKEKAAAKLARAEKKAAAKTA